MGVRTTSLALGRDAKLIQSHMPANNTMYTWMNFRVVGVVRSSIQVLSCAFLI
jgi:hypothetical protein